MWRLWASIVCAMGMQGCSLLLQSEPECQRDVCLIEEFDGELQPLRWAESDGVTFAPEAGEVRLIADTGGLSTLTYGTDSPTAALSRKNLVLEVTFTSLSTWSIDPDESGSASSVGVFLRDSEDRRHHFFGVEAPGTIFAWYEDWEDGTNNTLGCWNCLVPFDEELVAPESPLVLRLETDEEQVSFKVRFGDGEFEDITETIGLMELSSAAYVGVHALYDGDRAMATVDRMVLEGDLLK
jgi:hypothetical protein